MPTSIFTLTGDDTFTLFDRVFNDFIDGDTLSITYANELVAMKTGKNKNTIYSRNETGYNGECVMRLVRGSDDDKFMQSKIDALGADFPSFVLGSGQFVKRLGDGLGNIRREVYNLNGGIPSKSVDGKENKEADTEQAVSIYNIKFAYAVRSFQ